MKRLKIYFIANLIFLSIALLCKPILAAGAGGSTGPGAGGSTTNTGTTPSSSTATSISTGSPSSPYNNPSITSTTSDPSSVNTSAPNNGSNLNPPSNTNAIPAGTIPSEYNTPRQGQINPGTGGTIPGSSPTPPSGTSLTPSPNSTYPGNTSTNPGTNSTTTPGRMPGQNQSKHKTTQNSKSHISSLAYPNDVTPTGTADVHPAPTPPSPSAVNTPAQYKPGAANQPPAQDLEPKSPSSPPGYIPQGDQRPLNERPEDKDKDDLQRSFD